MQNTYFYDGVQEHKYLDYIAYNHTKPNQQPIKGTNNP